MGIISILSLILFFVIAYFINKLFDKYIKPFLEKVLEKYIGKMIDNYFEIWLINILIKGLTNGNHDKVYRFIELRKSYIEQGINYDKATTKAIYEMNNTKSN